MKKKETSRPGALAQRRKEDETVIEFQVFWKKSIDALKRFRKFFPVTRLEDLDTLKRTKIH